MYNKKKTFIPLFYWSIDLCNNFNHSIRGNFFSPKTSSLSFVSPSLIAFFLFFPCLCQVFSLESAFLKANLTFFIIISTRPAFYKVPFNDEIVINIPNSRKFGAFRWTLSKKSTENFKRSESVISKPDKRFSVC